MLLKDKFNLYIHTSNKVWGNLRTFFFFYKKKKKMHLDPAILKLTLYFVFSRRQHSHN